jgi:phosphoribosyl 1,2-cyclic phosphodiesterase
VRIVPVFVRHGARKEAGAEVVMNGMEIRFWGVRGSIASPGADTAGVGGNTSCVEVRCGESRLVLDAGTGLRRLGESMLREGPAGRVTLLLSHLHWDHIQGLPFFVPLYLPGTEIAVVGASSGPLSLREAFERQMSAPVFPVRLEDVPAKLGFRDIRPAERIHVGNAVITAAKLNHPGGVTAYRIEHGGRSIVYATDTEHYACVDPALVALARGADVLIYDSQYTPEEYSGAVGRPKVGWGHSTYEAGAAVARAAGVGKYVLFHHDPQRTDAAVADLERLACSLFPDSLAAREGLVLTLEATPEARAA